MELLHPIQFLIFNFYHKIFFSVGASLLLFYRVLAFSWFF
jgi:hypothetical protein